MAYYQTYRPQTIADLDNAKLRETLTAVLSSANIPHAFLFTGPKGLGKTSTARIIAKAVNCENKKPGDVEPCNTCDSCISITNGTNVDVLEIDGASNRGIDEIRDLREKVKLSPAKAKKKVYIIDEVHMLTTEAFNALLKTIEEPPSHVMFIFCTTEPQKVPATIISRCFHISLSLATPEELVRSLKRVAKGEKLSVSDDAFTFLAELADGGFRDGSKILEEMASLAKGEEITKAFIAEHFKIHNVTGYVDDFFTALQSKDAKKGLEIIATLISQGTDGKYFISQLLSSLHMQLLAAVEHKEGKFSLQEIQVLADMLQQAYKDMKFAVIAQLPLEMLVVAWCQQSESTEVLPAVSVAISSNKPTMTTLLKKEKNLKVQSILKPEPKKEEKKEDTSKIQEAISPDANAYSTLLENIIYKVKPYNHSVAGVLRGCTIVSMKDGKIVFETAYKFHKEKLQEAKIFDVLLQTIKEVTGKDYQVVIELKA